MKFRNTFKILFIFFICEITFAKRNQNNERTWIFQRVTIESDRRNLENRSSTTTLPKSESLSGNFYNLTEISQIAAENKIKSICVQSGLWAIFNSENYFDVGAILYASGLADDRACTTDDLNGTHPQYKSLRHLGNRKLTQSGISFYTGSFFTQEELYFDGWRLNLNQPIKIRSFGFTGKENWTIFEKTEFHGAKACVLSLHNGSSSSYDAVVYNKDVNLTVGSVERGCVHGSSGQDNDLSKSILIFPNKEIRSFIENPSSEFKPMQERFKNVDSLQLKILPINQTMENQFIFIDGDELRLSKGQMLHVDIHTQGVSNWTIFSGTNFNGKSRCIFASERKSTLSELDHEYSDVDLGSDETNEDDGERSMTLRMGSIKRGCDLTESHRQPRLFEIRIPNLEKTYEKSNTFENPNRKIFFASFLIVLGFLIFIILLGILTVSYFYLQNYHI